MYDKLINKQAKLAVIGLGYVGLPIALAFAKKMPLDKMLVETDSPYLAPVPHRGKSNQPAYVRHVLNFLSDLLGISSSQLSQRTSNNFFDLFNSAIPTK